jgi:NAD(P)-dependent dehydrogenase (short-subunit alcohol dehydrogenase family)
MKTWFITGTSKGFGRVWAEAALERGDNVAATARKTETLDALVEKYGDKVLPLQLDVTDKSAVESAVKEAHEKFGQLDVVINNAGYGLFGMVEELSEEQARQQMETNYFGTLWLTQAVLPILRKQGSGHIIQVSSIGGVNAFPNLGGYHASKWAVEGFTQSLAQEVGMFGIKVTLVEPGGYATDWGASSAVNATPNEAYDTFRSMLEEGRTKNPSNPGDPKATGPVMLELVDMEKPPLRMFFGKFINELIHGEYENRLAEWDAHKELSEKAQG